MNAPLELFTLADPAPAGVIAREFATVRQWVADRLSASHPDLGRSGNVCPFTGSSIKKNLFHVGFVRGATLHHATIVEVLEHIAAAFPSIAPADGPESVYKAVVVVFPELTDFDQIDAVHIECKNAFVQRGLMVGQFYPGHQQPGLRNPAFRPLDAPFAMLAVRHMVVTDYPFLCDNDAWMDAYAKRFATAESGGCPRGDRQQLRHPERATARQRTSASARTV